VKNPSWVSNESKETLHKELNTKQTNKVKPPPQYLTTVFEEVLSYSS
jgi:hypothetical protein